MKTVGGRKERVGFRSVARTEGRGHDGCAKLRVVVRQRWNPRWSWWLGTMAGGQSKREEAGGGGFRVANRFSRVVAGNGSSSVRLARGWSAVRTETEAYRWWVERFPAIGGGAVTRFDIGWREGSVLFHRRRLLLEPREAGRYGSVKISRRSIRWLELEGPESQTDWWPAELESSGGVASFFLFPSIYIM